MAQRAKRPKKDDIVVYRSGRSGDLVLAQVTEAFKGGIIYFRMAINGHVYDSLNRIRMGAGVDTPRNYGTWRWPKDKEIRCVRGKWRFA